MNTTSTCRAAVPAAALVNTSSRLLHLKFKIAILLLLPCLGTDSYSGVIYSQPHNGTASFYQSSWWDPDGSDYDQLTWDGFKLTNSQAITQIRWRGTYDPSHFGMGGPVIDFTVAIYGDIANGLQPDVTHAPLVQYTVGGNASESAAGNFGGVILYDYAFTLPAPFQAVANSNYWVLIEGWQHGIPDWGLAYGTGGNGSCFRRTAGMGDIRFYIASGETAFSLYGADIATFAITTAVSPIDGGTVLGTGNYPSNSTVTLTAIPNAGYGFQRWTVNGAQVGTSTRYTFTARSNRMVVANFVPAYTVAATATPTYAGTVTGAGTFNSNVTVNVTAIPASGFRFVNWTDWGAPVSTATNFSFTIDANHSLAANFEPLPQTAVFDFDTGWPSVSPMQGMPGSQSNHNLTAYFSPFNGSWSVQNTIYGWVSPLFSGNFLYPGTWWSTLSIQFAHPITNISLKFVTADLTTAGDVPTIVRVTGYTNSLSSPPVASASQQGSMWVNGPYPDGTLSMGATTAFNIVKLDFPSGQPMTISGLLFIDNIVVQRDLAPPTNVTITTASSPLAGGTTTGDGVYSNAAPVTVTATPAPGYVFLDWAEFGVPLTTNTSYSFTATEDRTLIAEFAAVYTITTEASPAAAGTVSSGGTFLDGSWVTCTATANPGYVFSDWLENGVVVSYSATFDYFVYTNATLTAAFVAHPPPTANPDTFSRTKNLSIKVTVADLLANDFDADGDPIWVADVSPTTTNHLPLLWDGLCVYYPATNVNVADEFTYTIADLYGQLATANVTINVVDPPPGQVTCIDSLSNNCANVYFAGIPGLGYVVQRTTNLVGWVNIHTNLAPSNGVFSHQDFFPDLGSNAPPAAYYRLLWQ